MDVEVRNALRQVDLADQRAELLDEILSKIDNEGLMLLVSKVVEQIFEQSSSFADVLNAETTIRNSIRFALSKHEAAWRQENGMPTSPAQPTKADLEEIREQILAHGPTLAPGKGYVIQTTNNIDMSIVLYKLRSLMREHGYSLNTSGKVELMPSASADNSLVLGIRL